MKTDQDCQPRASDCDGVGLARLKRADALARWVVWVIWLAMTTVALVFVFLTGHNIPFHEDWVLVKPLTGHQSHFWAWVWNQNTDHRNPIPRLILLGLLGLTGGDFRAGMVFNVLSLSAAAGVVILMVRKLRGGRTEWADAFFPMLFLHLGHSENLGISWQVAFVFPTLVALAALLLLVVPRSEEIPFRALLMAICLIVLPLTGTNGLLFVPFLAFWSLFWAARHWLERSVPPENRRTILIQVAGGTISVGLACLYFVHYKLSEQALIKSGLMEKVITAGDIVVLGLGPGAIGFRAASLVVTSTLIVATFGLLVRSLRRSCEDRGRTLGILLGLTACIAATLVTGWGRAGAKQLYGSLPNRYSILCLPLFCLIFFVWELYGSAKVRKIVQLALLALMCVLLPLNTFSGLMYQKPYRQGMRALERDIAAGKPALELAQAHGKLLIGWWKPALLAEHIRMLQACGMSNFGKNGIGVPDSAPVRGNF